MICSECDNPIPPNPATGRVSLKRKTCSVKCSIKRENRIKQEREAPAHPQPYPERYCKNPECGKRLEPKVKNGKLETPKQLEKRRCCGVVCRERAKYLEKTAAIKIDIPVSLTPAEELQARLDELDDIYAKADEIVRALVRQRRERLQREFGGVA